MGEEAKVNDQIDGRYVLTEKLSQGSVGSIWSATQLVDGAPVALKLLRPEVARLPHLRRRFAREARAASRLLHPNIAAMVDYGMEEGGLMYITMELLRGEVVTDLIRRGLSLQHILLLADQLLAGLAHAHARGVVHRDLKPANLMVVDGDLPRRLGTLKIVDFGIARVQSDHDPRETAQGEVVGTPRYMSPEQAAGDRQLGPRTDLYNVGLILYELISGRPPFGDGKGLMVMASHVHDEIPQLVPRAGLQISEDLREFITRALEKEPSKRWPSAAEMRSVIGHFLTLTRDDPSTLVAPSPVESLEGGHSTVEESAVMRSIDAHSESSEREEQELRGSGTLRSAVVNPQQRIPFVGRRKKRERLKSFVDEVRSEGRGKVVLLYGEAGVGKTRLTMWVKEYAEEEGLLHGHIGAFTRGNADGMQGLREVLDSLFGTRRMVREDVEGELTRRLGEWGYSDTVEISRIADFMRPAGPDSEVRSLPLAPSKLFALLARVFELAARQRPRLIIIDDLHWASREVGEFLDFLAVEMRHRALPLMVMATIRTEDLSENPALATRLEGLSRYTGETVERINLGRLAPESGRHLVRLVLPVDDDLADTIYERSGGNPLHLVLLLRYLRQEGLLVWDGERWVPSDEEAVRAAVPPSLADLFRVRLEQIEDRYQAKGRLERLLQRAAIAGPRFTYDVLLEMVRLEDKQEARENFDDDFDHLLSEGLLLESHGRREEWYTFSHGVVHDFFLTRVGGARRARILHGLAAQARENVYTLRPDSHAAEIASDWEAAGERERALDWYLRAAQTARRAVTYRQASLAFRAALRLMNELLDLDEMARVDLRIHELRHRCAEVDLEARTYVKVLVALGDLYEGFGEFEASEKHYRQVVRMVGVSPGDDLERGALSESWLGLGHISWQRGDFEGATWAFTRVSELVEGHEKLEEIGARAKRGLARVAWHRGDYEEAQKLAYEALESSRSRSDTVGHAQALWVVGEIARMRGDGGEARKHFEESQKLYASVGKASGLARNLLSLAQLARYQKNFREAEELYQRALRRYQALGSRRGAGQCFNGLGDVARFLGDHKGARENYEQALSIYQSIGAQYDVAVVFANLGLSAMRLNDLDGAKRFLEASRSLATGAEYPYLQAGVEYNLALVEAMRGDHQESSEILGRVLELSERFRIPDLDYAQPLEELARIRSEAGAPAEAKELWERARNIYSELALVDDQRRLESLLDEI